MKTKLCLNCGKEIRRTKVWNSWRTYKIDISNKQWERKKFCSERCANAHRIRKKYKNDEQYRNYQKQWKKDNMTKERKRRYYENSKPKRKQYYERLKKENPEKINRLRKQSLECIRKNRKNIFNHYDNKCAICGFKEVLDIHHINGRKSKIWIRPMEEYIVLCPNHHTMFHRGKIKKEELIKYRRL